MQDERAAATQADDRAATRDGDRGAAGLVAEVHADIARVTGLALPLQLWDGTRLGPDDAGFRVLLRRPWSLRSLLVPPDDLSAGEAYVEDDVDIEGSAVAAMRAGARLAQAGLPARTRLRLLTGLLRLPRPPRRAHARRARLRGRLHSPRRDRAAIAFHYDLGLDFYRQFLGSTMVYSCAYFAGADEDLDAAQIRKLDLICRKLRLRPGTRLLDIGCGFGSLLIHAATHYGAHGLGVTLSQTQADAGRARVAAAGVDDLVQVQLRDYRSLDSQFDAVASVGMVEHVGVEHLPEYFRALWRLTAPGGLMLNHGIVTGRADDVRSKTDRTFVAKYVFPDGGLAPAWRGVRDLQRAGFELVDVEQLRPHYALTLQRWVDRLESRHDAVVASASETDYRIWRVYMAGAAVSFEQGALGVVQLLGSKGHALPLGRDWMLRSAGAADRTRP